MKLEIPVKLENNNKAKLKLLNCFLKDLTNVEIDIVSTMLDKDYITLTTEVRPLLRSTLDMTKYNFNNYIKKLSDKGILLLHPKDKVFVLNPRVKELMSDNVITVEFKPYE